jgi:class 3 adenylate cyclase
MGSGFGIWVSIDTARVGIGVFGVLFIVALVVVLTRNYLREGPVGRRQIKWLIWTVYVAALPLILTSALVAVDPAFIPWAFASIGALCVIPVGLAIGIYRYNWLDIDRLLSTTASINLIAFLGVAIAFVLVPRFAGALSRSLEVGPEAGQMAVSLLFAAAFVPAHRRLRPAIERVLLPDRHAVDLGAAQFQRELLLCSDTQSLVECLGRGLDEVFQSESCVIYSPSGEAWETVFERGLAIPVAIEGDGPLIATLRNRHTPLAIGSDGVRGTPLPDGFDRAVLDTLDAAVVLPITRGESIALVACLGPKRSGDVYAVTDLNLLAAVIARVSAKLDRFDHARVEAQSQEMQRALRRYVPGVVVETLASGAKLEAAECEVSVLFADIRGYTAFSEKRGASDIFDAVNRYTETVSEVVRRHAGSVVEFHGDGLMAVFGAPNPLEAKERSAVAAGRAIFAEVSALRGDAIGTELTVGVGIATGTAFVGNIQAIDRMIWSALGNTTNLAARLEGLTRSLGAAIAIDEPTWLAVRDFELGFQCVEDVPIKGRRDCITVYTLPLPDQPGRG